MMRTPTKRRSYADHREYYKNIAPKIETRWEKGTPLMRKGKIVNKRRRSDSELLHLPLPLNLPSSSPREIIDEESDNDAFVPSISMNSVLTENQSDGMESNSISMDVSAHMEVVSFHFKDLFLQLEAYLNTKSSETEKNFVEKQMKDLKEHANQIEYMINDLNERAIRLEKFLTSRLRNGEENLEWKN